MTTGIGKKNAKKNTTSSVRTKKKNEDGHKLTTPNHRVYVALFQDQYDFYLALQQQKGGKIAEFVREDARIGQKTRRGILVAPPTLKELKQQVSSLQREVADLQKLVTENLTVLHSIQGAVRYLFAASKAHNFPQLSEEALDEWERIKDKSGDITAQKIAAMQPKRKSTPAPMTESEEPEDEDPDYEE